MVRKTVTIAELKSRLAQKEEALRKLGAVRKKLTTQLEKVDARIAELEGAPVKRGRKPAAVTARRGRPKGSGRGKTLKQAIVEVLGADRKALRAKEIAAALPGVGYSSKSKSLLTMIGAALSKTPEFGRVARGKYRLLRRRGRPPAAAKVKAKAPAKPKG